MEMDEKQANGLGRTATLLLMPLAVLAVAGFGAFFYVGMPQDEQAPAGPPRAGKAASATADAPVKMTPEEKMKIIDNSEKKGAAVPTDTGQAVTVKVDLGYTPNVIEVKKGVPLFITFEWVATANNAATKHGFPSMGSVMTILPKDGKMTLVVPIPNEAGHTIDFMCGMKLMKGKLVTVD
jgi:plastocyanin domain-containing protein